MSGNFHRNIENLPSFWLTTAWGLKITPHRLASTHHRYLSIFSIVIPFSFYLLLISFWFIFFLRNLRSSFLRGISGHPVYIYTYLFNSLPDILLLTHLTSKERHINENEGIYRFKLLFCKGEWFMEILNVTLIELTDSYTREKISVNK